MTFRVWCLYLVHGRKINFYNKGDQEDVNFYTFLDIWLMRDWMRLGAVFTLVGGTVTGCTVHVHIKT
jgi:hypothetical protein